MTPTSELRAQALLNHLPTSGGIAGVELGVDRGDMSESLLKRHSDLFLYMVDPYPPPDQWPESYKQSRDYHARLSPEEQEKRWKRALAATAFAADRTRLFKMFSWDAAAMVPEVDFVFIDGDHTYEGVKADIAAWTGKVKSGGILGGHDYSYETESGKGVSKAVDEAGAMFGWFLMKGEDRTWFVRL